jgi:hypothetical protein
MSTDGTEEILVGDAAASVFLNSTYQAGVKAREAR